jgi:hypothetical protein
LKKLITSGMFVVGMVALPAALSPRPATTTSTPDFRNDPRLSTLRNFFHKAACPAERYAEAFLESADSNALDWRLLPSLSFVESTGGKNAQHNNIFGWNSGHTHFPSAVAGIHAVGYHLSHSDRYKFKGLDTVLAIYNPNLEYVRKVKSVMRQISPSERIAFQ